MKWSIFVRRNQNLPLSGNVSLRSDICDSPFPPVSIPQPASSIRKRNPATTRFLACELLRIVCSHHRNAESVRYPPFRPLSRTRTTQRPGTALRQAATSRKSGDDTKARAE
ncbi:hypothetical protein HYQ45_002972 [Verticillium longisporum]|uniref:Uncharacterized protein n=1 Tax=Verticillium longisporum TaxID=100787 RepID=A0A8I3AUU7_VERLO|nr:hypothetical protein HYQ45_002972 [Verticillium longisporum]